MDFLLVALQASFFAPVLVRAAGWREAGGGERAGLSREIAAGLRQPVLVLHEAAMVLVWVGVALALAGGRVPRALTLRGILGAAVLAGAAGLMTWATFRLRSWRLLPKVAAGHELCTSGPYRLVRHPIYLALDLLGAGSAIWVGSPLVVVAAILLFASGDRRARLEEKALLEAFGDRYREYMRQTRRTIPFLY